MLISLISDYNRSLRKRTEEMEMKKIMKEISTKFQHWEKPSLEIEEVHRWARKEKPLRKKKKG